jgi:hypothetical protein
VHLDLVQLTLVGVLARDSSPKERQCASSQRGKKSLAGPAAFAPGSVARASGRWRPSSGPHGVEVRGGEAERSRKPSAPIS